MGHGHKTINQCAGWAAADFLAQLKTYMSENDITQAELAEKLGVTEGRVSQIFRKPDNLSLRSVVKLVRAIGLKMAVVGYDSEDDAPHITGEAVREAWEQAGRPRTFRNLLEKRAPRLPE